MKILPRYLFLTGKLFGLISVLLALGLVVATAQVSPQPTPSPTPTPLPPTTSNPPGPGTFPLRLSPDKLEFPAHDIGTTSYSQAVTVKNNGKVALRINAVISLNDVEFALEKSCPQDSITPGAECSFHVKFTPIHTTSEGELKVNFAPVDDSSPASNQVIRLTGLGAVPKLRLSQPALDFDSQLIGSTSLVRTLILTAGKETVDVLAVTTTGDFTVTPVNCPDLQPSASCVLSVTFVPKAVGPTSGSLTIVNDKTAAKVVPLTAIGIASCNASADLWNWKQVVPVLLIVLIYLSALVLVRWNMIARPTRNLLIAEIGAVRQRIEILHSPNAPGLAQVSELINQADNLVNDANASRWLDHLFWSRGQELAAWGYIHEAEEQLVFLLPPQTVRAELERVEDDLREVATPTAMGLANRIHESLISVSPLTLKDPSRQALEEILQFLQSTGANVAKDVSKALSSDAILTDVQWLELARKVLGFLTPETTSITERIHQALHDPAVTVEQMRPLLEQSAKLLETDRIKVAAILEEACQAATATPPRPLTADQWKAVLSKFHDYFTPHASIMVRIKEELAAKPELPIERWRALHGEALGYLYNRSDTIFGQLVCWQNKTVWLVGSSLLLIVALAATLNHGILFLVGATGGLMSRLARSLSSDDVPTDYGASWSTLFLSPVIGALAGWAGILLVIVGVEFNILGSALKFDWCNTYNPVMLGIALVLGCSERFFDGILSQINRKIGGALPTSPPSPPPAPFVIATSAVLPEGKVDQPYSQPLKASGGTPPYGWALVSGTLPAGLSLDPGGQISGTPTATGTGKFTLQVSDASAKVLSLEFTLVVS